MTKMDTVKGPSSPMVIFSLFKKKEGILGASKRATGPVSPKSPSPVQGVISFPNSSQALPRGRLPASLVWQLENGNMGAPYDFIALKAAAHAGGRSAGPVDTAVWRLREELGVHAMTSDALLLHAEQLGEGGWRGYLWGYSALSVRGVLCVAEGKEQLKAWLGSRECQEELAGVAADRVHVYHDGRVVPRQRLEECVARRGFESAYAELFNPPPTAPTDDNGRLAALAKEIGGLRAAREGGRERLAEALGEVGRMQYGRGKYAKAREALEEALAILDALPPPPGGGARAGVARVCGHLGVVSHMLGQDRKALEYHARELAARAGGGEEGGPLAVAAAHGNMGAAHRSLGQLERALECYALELELRAGALGSAHVSLAAVYASSGAVYRALKDPARALECHARALAIAEAAGGDVAAAHANIGTLHREAGRHAAALRALSAALATLRAGGKPDGDRAAGILEEMAGVRAEAGDIKGAILDCEAALAAYARGGVRARAQKAESTLRWLRSSKYYRVKKGLVRSASAHL